jgi:very-short-patch-repair endonuclease
LYGEKNIMLLLDNEGIAYEHQFRIDNMVPDIKVGNLIIECDGLYWHSDQFLDKKYHIKKKEKYTLLGYDSLFFRSNEINDKPDIVKSIILNKLGRCPNKIGARKLSIQQISHKEATQFFSANHLMGPAGSSNFNAALIGDVRILSCMQFRRLKDKVYEVARFANELHHSVPGAYSRLLTFFSSQSSPSSLVNFIDQRYGKGEYLSQFGFKYTGTHVGFHWTDGINAFNRRKYLGNSGYSEGMVKIYDCGQARYLKVY